jgi:hypothetical protein
MGEERERGRGDELEKEREREEGGGGGAICITVCVLPFLLSCWSVRLRLALFSNRNERARCVLCLVLSIGVCTARRPFFLSFQPASSNNPQRNGRMSNQVFLPPRVKVRDRVRVMVIG